MSYSYSASSYSSGGDGIADASLSYNDGITIGGAIGGASLGGGSTTIVSGGNSLGLGGGALGGGSAYNESISFGGAAISGDRSAQAASDILALGGAGSAGASSGATFSSTTYSTGGGAADFGGASISLGGGSIGGGAAGGAGGASQIYLSEIENSIIRSNQPIQINESEEITVNGQRGIWANRAEVVNWRGVIPITQYVINEDSNPEIITKRSNQTLDYVQELAIRYLRPPTPPAPGEIIIQQQANLVTPPAPPLIIRQQPPRPPTPEPLVIREAPPQPPSQVGRKVITISGKRLPPPPRKVIIERLAPLPAKPQSVIVERWLPYAQTKRRVIFQRAAQVDPVIVRPRNVIVQWEAPRVNIRREIKYLGVIRANPAEYVQRYGSSLKSANELPDYVASIKTPEGLVLAANYRYNNIYELEGDLQALRLVDLDREGLAEYRSYLSNLGISYDARFASSGNLDAIGGGGFSGATISTSGAIGGASGFGGAIGGGAGSSFATISTGGGNAELDAIFASVDSSGDGYVSIDEARALFLRLNSRLGRNYGEDDIKNFFARLDINKDGRLSIQEFKAAFFRL